jgi:chromosome partitioning protein
MSPGTTPVVAVLNMKGGVGKTTISAHLMRIVYQLAGVNGLLIDLDPQFNLTQVLVKKTDYNLLRDSRQTIYSVLENSPEVSLYDITTSNAPPPDPKSLARNVHSYTTSAGRIVLDLIPGDFSLVKYSLMDNDAKLAELQQRFLKFVDAARAEYGLVCIDCNPSSSFITSCALHACSHLLIPIRPDLYSVIGVELLDKLLGRFVSKLPKPATIILINNVQGPDYDPVIVTDLRGHAVFGSEVLANTLRRSKLLEARSTSIGFAADKSGPHARRLYRDMLPLADELAQKLGLK